MGKAIIQANNGAGWYTVDEVFDNTWGKENYNRLTGELVAFNASLIKLENQRTLLLDELETVENALIAAMIAGEDTAPYVEQQSRIVSEIEKINHPIFVLKSQINNANIQLQHLSPDDEIYVSISAWSADYNDSIPLLTIVGIVDRKRTDQAKNFITIKPTFRDSGTDGYLWIEAEDGTLFHKYGQPSSGWAWNYGMADGSDTWEPRFIYADIHTINYDDDTCEILLDDFFAKSISPYGRDPVLPMPAVISYMDCNSLAFVEGNAVVVDVSDPDNFIVTGFQQVPVECPQRYMLQMDEPQLLVAQFGSNRVSLLSLCDGDTQQSPAWDFATPIIPFLINLQTLGSTMTIQIPTPLGGINKFEDVVVQPDFIWEVVTENPPDKFFNGTLESKIRTGQDEFTFIFFKSTSGGLCSDFIPGHISYRWDGSNIPEQHPVTTIPPVTVVGQTTGWTYDIYGFYNTGLVSGPLTFIAIPRP